MHRPSLLFSWRMLLCWAFVCCLTASAQQAMPSSSKTLVSEWVFNLLTLSDGLSSNCIGALRQDRYGRLWIGTSRGIDRYDGHRMEHLMPGGRIVQVLSMCETNRGMWIGTGEGLFFYEYRSDSLFAFDGCTAEGERLHTDIYDIRTDGADGLWVTAYGQGIYRLRTDGVQPEARRYPLPHDERRTGFILTDREGHVWSLGAWGDDRLCLLNETQGCFESYPLRLRGKPLWVSGLALTETADGWIYIGNDVGRLIRFRPGSHEAELINLGDDLGIIRSLTLCSDDLLLIGSDNGLTFYNRRTGSVRRERSDTAAPGKLTDNFVYATLIDREQTLWAGTYYGGLNRMHPEFTNFTQYKMQGIFPSDHSAVTGCLAEDGEGTVWVGSDGGGIARFDPSTRSLSRVEGLAGMTYVRSLCIDGDVLVAGLYTRGIVFYDIRTGHVKHVPLFRNADGLELESTAQSLLTDADGRLWVGTYSMICTYDRERHCVKVERDSTSVVNGMCEDGRRRLWFATSSGGVLCFDSHSGRWRQYDVTTEGHTGSDVCNVVHADRQGRVWLGTIQGLYRYDERSDGFVPMPLGRACIEILGILDEGEDSSTTSRHRAGFTRFTGQAAVSLTLNSFRAACCSAATG